MKDNKKKMKMMKRKEGKLNNCDYVLKFCLQTIIRLMSHL